MTLASPKNLTGEVPVRTALDWATADAAEGVRESEGVNRSPRIDEINRFIGSPLGSPYCAAGVSWCFHQAGASAFPASASAGAIHDWFAERGLASHRPNDLRRWRGALFGWTHPDGHGHIGFVRRRLTDASGSVVAIGTVEYNTEPPAAREGLAGPDIGGVWERERPVEDGGSMWFLRCDQFPGGQWWDR